MPTTASHASAPEQDAPTRSVDADTPAVPRNPPFALSRVGEDRLSHCAEPLTDQAREEAIARAGRAIERHMDKWLSAGDFAARGDAVRALRLMELLIAGRSQEQVARMEEERGLR